MNERLRFTTFVTLGAAAAPVPPPRPTEVVVEYAEWRAGDGDRPAVVGEPWSFLALAEEPEHLAGTEPAERTSLVQVDGARYAFHARPIASGATIFAGSSGVTAYEACGFRFALDDPPTEGWLSGVAAMRYDTYDVEDDAVVAACRQTLEVTRIALVRRSVVGIPGQGVGIPGATTGVEEVDATRPVRLDHVSETATFLVSVRLPA